jgi:palmitoyltransferase ZDHHC1/11
VFAVSILFIRCTSINPADPGIMSKFEDGFTDAPARTADLEDTNLPEKVDDAAEAKSSTSTCRSSLNGHSNRAGLTAGDANINRSSQLPRSSGSCLLGGFICALFIKADCRKFDDSENQVDGEDALFCTICNAEVCPFAWLFNVSTTRFICSIFCQ